MSFYKKAVAGATPESIKKPFGMKDKLAYAAGDFGCNMSFALSGTYLMVFWTEFMGFSNNPDPVQASVETLAIWSIIILLVKIWDAINDPIIGGLIDKIQPKPGQSKFKPWIFWGSIALMFGGAVCFIPIPTAPVSRS
jgi:GPH family glycoside/pentoside/hexuronide:cation symporter